MKRQIEFLRESLKTRGLKHTRSRELVFREIWRQAESHRNAADIYRSLKKKGYRVSLATVYRTLQVLVRIGLVRAEDLGEKHSHYEPHAPGIAHGHLICLSCGRVEEFVEGKVAAEIEAIGASHGFRLARFSLQVFGFCQKCSRYSSQG